MVSCDLPKSSQPLNTVVDGPDDYKTAEGIAIAWLDDGKKGVRIGIEFVYDLEEEEEDQIEEDSDEVMPIAKKARKVSC